MADFHADHDISIHLVHALRQGGHNVTRARDVGLARASDAEQLLFAFHEHRILISHNRADFYVLQHAWLLWPPAWGISNAEHLGILVLDHQPPMDAIADLLNRRPRLANQLYDWSRGNGWRHFTIDRPERLVPLH